MSLDSAEIDTLGVTGDRRLMLVDASGRFLSQREVPRLATIAANLADDLLHATAPRLDKLVVRIDCERPSIKVRIWRDEVVAVEQGSRAAEWFTRAAGVACRLVWFGPDSRRQLDPEFWPQADAGTAFADGYPILLTSADSLLALNGSLADPVAMARFRPNVVIAGGTPWSEDGWERVMLGSLRFAVVKPCGRCVVTTTDQATGQRDSAREPLRTLARLRTVPGLGALFGQNLVPLGTGRIALNDEVEPLT